MVTITVYGDTPRETAETVRLLSSPAITNNLHLQPADEDAIKDAVASYLVELKEKGVFDHPTS